MQTDAHRYCTRRNDEYFSHDHRILKCRYQKNHELTCDFLDGLLNTLSAAELREVILLAYNSYGLYSYALYGNGLSYGLYSYSLYRLDRYTVTTYMVVYTYGRIYL